MFETLKQSTGMKIFVYLVILLVCSLLGALASFFLVIGDNDTLLKIGQGISSTMMFIVPPIVFYCLTRKERPMQALGFRRISPVWLVFVGLVLMFISLPVTNQLTAWNESLKLGGIFQRLEDLMQHMEQAAADVTERMLHADSFGGLLFNLLIIALIPAIGEELTFRGVLQQALTRGMKNPHVAIWLSAALFSFIHFQFYGFLPRMFLGLLLGYLFYTTGSLWTSIAMHFLNNGTAVVLYYLNSKGTIDVDVDHFGAVQSPWLIAASAVVTAGLVTWCWRKGDIKDKKTHY